MGGLGNVLFQVLAYNIASSNEINVKYIDLLTRKNLITKLLGWTIHEKLYSEFIPSIQIRNIGKIKAFLILSVALLSKRFTFKNRLSTFYDSKSKFDEPYSTNIFGYFQDKDFLNKNKNEILKLGMLIRKTYKKQEARIVVHYRFGDSHWARKNHSYYKLVKEHIKKENESVLIATDSPKEALLFFSDCDNVTLIESTNAIDDLEYMVSAKKLYCAPSTFSWWIAHSLDQTSTIIVPRFFYEKLGIYTTNVKNIHCIEE